MKKWPRRKKERRLDGANKVREWAKGPEEKETTKKKPFNPFCGCKEEGRRERAQ